MEACFLLVHHLKAACFEDQVEEERSCDVEAEGLVVLHPMMDRCQVAVVVVGFVLVAEGDLTVDVLVAGYEIAESLGLAHKSLGVGPDGVAAAAVGIAQLLFRVRVPQLSRVIHALVPCRCVALFPDAAPLLHGELAHVPYPCARAQELAVEFVVQSISVVVVVQDTVARLLLAQD